MVSNSNKKEDGDRDRFIAYLESLEGLKFRTVDQDVRTRSGTHDFDYLLEDQKGRSLALEVTWLTQPDELMSESMRKVILDALSPLKSIQNLPGRFVVEFPYDPQTFCSSKAALISTLRIVGSQLVDDLVAAARNNVEFKSISSKAGPFTIRRLGEGDGISMASHAMRFNTHPNEWEYFYELGAELIPKKNRQLDYDAERRILLIGNTCYMACDEVIVGAFSQFIEGAVVQMSNIDEIYVDLSIDQFQLLYSRPRAQQALGADSP